MDSKPAKALEELSEIVRSQQEIVRVSFVQLDNTLLNYKASSESWSVLECLEHLNRYCYYYLPALNKAIINNQTGHISQKIEYTWLGKKSLEMVQPYNQKKQKTLKHMNPNMSRLSPTTIDKFLKYQDELLLLLDKARTADLNKKAVPVEFFKLLKMRIGETLTFLILHQERHLQQALRVNQNQVNSAAI